MTTKDSFNLSPYFKLVNLEKLSFTQVFTIRRSWLKLMIKTKKALVEAEKKVSK